MSRVGVEGVGGWGGDNDLEMLFMKLDFSTPAGKVILDF